jgi:hypothetical protein
MSGAGLIVAGYLVGVVEVDPARYGPERVRARPVADVLELADSRRVLEELAPGCRPNTRNWATGGACG